MTRGITATELSAEELRDRIGEVFATEGSFVPRHLGDELKQLVIALEAVAP